VSERRSANEYPFEYDEAEVKRLAFQGEFFEDLTRDFLREAGVAQARRVVEVGCGTGEVTRILVDLLPPGSFVLATDRDAAALSVLRDRLPEWTRDKQVRVECVHAPLEDFPPAAERFDALVSRLVLMYSPDPRQSVAKMAGAVRPGGVVACQESDHRIYFATEPQNALFDQYRRHLDGIAVERNVRLNIGLDLEAIFTDVGLVGLKKVEGMSPRQDGKSGVCRLLAGTYVGVTSTGTAEQKAIQIEELEAKLRAEAVQKGLKVYSSRLIGVAGTRPA
jgi:ubiquinone/menaquinone biosynthesis C-methylase UbiE